MWVWLVDPRREPAPPSRTPLLDMERSYRHCIRAFIQSAHHREISIYSFLTDTELLCKILYTSRITDHIIHILPSTSIHNTYNIQHVVHRYTSEYIIYNTIQYNTDSKPGKTQYIVHAWRFIYLVVPSQNHTSQLVRLSP